ncbi:MAG: glycogen operon protein GlgX [Roseburia sp.]|nr:glycogen operon protein GlgX [Roseburia sp.]
MEYNVKKGDFSPIGAVKGKGFVNFCVECRRETDCAILLYPRKESGDKVQILVPEEYSRGNLRAVKIFGINMEEYDYTFEIDGVEVLDPYARQIVGREVWADAKRSKMPEKGLKCRLANHSFSWRSDREVHVARKDMVLYKLHVRGFTKSLPEHVPDRGTFRGFTRRIPYLKSLGVTTVEFMPVYEFEELERQESTEVPEYLNWQEKESDKIKKPGKEQEYKINFWGYGPGMYFAPKAAYGATDDPVAEFKDCVMKLHKNGMECILEMDFPEGVSNRMMLEALRYWVEEYHVDGFHLQGQNVPINLILEDPYLGRTKIFYRNMPKNLIPQEEVEYPRCFVDSDEFLYPARKLLNGINGNVWELADQMKKQDDKLGYVNYICDNNGFTLADLFTYDVKHNEANREGNRDGADWNYSSNCGVEGETTSRNVLKIRDRKMKNAIAMLFLSQGVPMLMAGDEDGNSQGGNNNAYCQDNEVGYKDWKQTNVSREFLRFVKKMIAFRREHAILRKEKPMQLSDYRSYGFPDLSYHEENPWINPWHINRRALGILYCGKYAEEDENIYIGFNFSDFRKKLSFPKEKRKRKWHLHMDTSGRQAFLPTPVAVSETYYILEPQSVCILIGK